MKSMYILLFLGFIACAGLFVFTFEGDRQRAEELREKNRRVQIETMEKVQQIQEEKAYLVSIEQTKTTYRLNFSNGQSINITSISHHSAGSHLKMD